MNRRRWFRVGPATAMAVVLVAWLLWQRTRPPRVEHHTETATPGGDVLVGVPDPPFVLEHAAQLDIDDTQRSALAELAQRYEADTRSLQDALDQAADAVRHGLDSADPAGAGPADPRVADVATLSGQLAAKRRDGWASVARLLSDDQQQRARELWAAAHTLRPNAERGQERGGG